MGESGMAFAGRIAVSADAGAVSGTIAAVDAREGACLVRVMIDVPQNDIRSLPGQGEIR
ncbi:MAG: hypothetical protein PHP66_09390 [Syntrophales bacterium]|jgi:hypothetical protein|nr:hypothetical protein [Syntrophales bacterium]